MNTQALEVSSPRARLRTRRLLRAVAYTFYLALVIEAGSYTALRLGSGIHYSLLRFRQEINALTSSENASKSSREARQSTSSIHPYLGFLPRFQGRQRVESGLGLNQPEFYFTDSPFFSPEKDQLVVGVTGGSLANLFTRGPGGKELRTLLEAMPRFEGKTVVLALMGFGGYKQPQQLMALNYVLVLGGHLDILVNLDGFNEIALHESENQKRGIAASYPRAWYSRVYRNEVSGPLLVEWKGLRRSREESAQRALESSLRYSWTYRFLWKQRDRRFERSMQGVVDALQLLDPSDDLILVGPASHASDRDERFRELTRIWKQSSRQIDQVCDANGIEYYHFLQPNQYVAGSKELSPEELEQFFNPKHPYGQTVPTGYPMLIRAGVELIQAGVRFADLTQVFSETEQTVYRDDCCHVNDLGNLLIARAIAAFIESH